MYVCVYIYIYIYVCNLNVSTISGRRCLYDVMYFVVNGFSCEILYITLIRCHSHF
jgi:hypothetical protein